MIHLFQKSILTAVLAICPAIMALEDQRGSKVEIGVAFTLEDVTALEETCEKTLGQVMSLIAQGEPISRLEKLLKAYLEGLYKAARVQAENNIKNNDLAAAFRILTGLEHTLQAYTDKSAWNRLLAANPAIMALLAKK